MEDTPMKILVLDTHSNAGTATIHSLGRAGYEIQAVSHLSDALGFFSRYCSKYHLVSDPFVEPDTYHRELDEIVIDNNIDWIFPTTETSITILLKYGSERIKSIALLPPEDQFSIAFDKQKTLELATTLDIPVPSNILLENTQALHQQINHPLPLFIKPIRSKSWNTGEGKSMVAKLVSTQNELIHVGTEFLKDGPIQLQTIVTGPGVGVEVLAKSGEVIQYFAHERIHEYPLTGGGSTLRKAIPVPNVLREYVEKMTKALSWDGLAMFEFKGTPEQGYWLIEINGRLWGSVPLPISCGVNFPLMWLEQKLGKPLTAQESYPLLHQRNIVKDARWQIENMKAKANDNLPHARPKLASLLGMLMFLFGKERWDHIHRDDASLMVEVIRRAFEIWLSPFRSRARTLSLMARMKLNYVRFKRSLKPRKALILCYGNIYRSAFAEQYLKKICPGTEVKSAGFHLKENRSSPENIQAAAKSSYDIDLSSHNSKRLTDADIAWADSIFIMDKDNLVLLKESFPDALNKTTFLGYFSDTGKPIIEDPYRKSASELSTTLKKIAHSIKSAALTFGWQ